MSEDQATIASSCSCTASPPTRPAGAAAPRAGGRADRDTALLAAIEASDAREVARQLAAGADPRVHDDENIPALLLAIDSEPPDTTILTRLLDAGADVDAVDPILQETALACAAKRGLLETVDLLIARGAAVDRRNQGDDDNTILLAVLDPNYTDDPNPAVIAALLRAGADADAANCNGWTPLMFAAHHRSPAALDVLLTAGADPKLARGPGIHAIDVAEAQSHDHHVWRLIIAGSPTPAETAAARVDAVWARIDAVFTAHAPELHTFVATARGAAPNHIARLERALGTRLPADFHAYLRRFGASSRLPLREYTALPAAQILERWRDLEDLRKQGIFKKAEPHELSKDREEIRWTWWHHGWLPFAEDGGGNLYCIDLDPGPRGRRGQVIGWELHGGPIGPRARSFDIFLDDYAEQLESGDREFFDLVL